MARGGYRQQGSDQAVRVTFRPGLGLDNIKAITGASIGLFAGLVLLGSRTLRLDAGVALALASLVTLAVAALLARLARQAHEVVIEPDTVTIRSRYLLAFWDEQRVARSAVRRLERVQAWGTVHLRLEMRAGEHVPLFEGLDLDPDTAERMGTAIERALDPDQIDDLADEHRAVTSAEK